MTLLKFRFKYKVLIIVLSLSTVLHSHEEIEFTHYTSEDGLSLNSVSQILQDSRGFLWFGTFNGLNRYDGYSYKNFFPDQANPFSISNHSIWSLYEDSEENIWIGTLDGLNKFDWKTEKFIKYKNNPKDPNSLSDNHIYNVFEDSEGVIWVATLNGLNKYNPKKDNFKVIMQVSDQLNLSYNNTVTTITEDINGLLWLGTWNGITCMNKKGEIVKQYFAEPDTSKNFDYRKITNIFKDKSNSIWVGTNGKGLKKYDAKTGKFKEYKKENNNRKSISSNYVTIIFQDKFNNIWIGTKSGLNKYDPSTDNFIQINNDPQKPLSLINDEIFTIYEDKYGFIWIGTSGGVSKFYKNTNKFFIYTTNKTKSFGGLTNSNISSLYIGSNDNLWVGSLEGIDLIKKGSDKVVHFENYPNNKNSLSSNYIMSIYEDKIGYIWIGTQNDGLNRYDPETGEFKLYAFNVNDTQSISNNGILSGCEDREGNIWFGTWWGFNKFERKTEKFTRYNSADDDPSTLKSNLIWDIQEDSQGKIWLGTDGGGAIRFDPQNNSYINFMNDSSSSNFIKGYRVFSIYKSSDSTIWFCTSDGLGSYNVNNNVKRYYTTQDGLPGDVVTGLIEDGKGFLWIGTDKGLTKFDKKRGNFINYTKRDGLKNLEFSNNCVTKSKDGTLYFGTKNGIIYFHPDSIKDNQTFAPIVFTDLKIYNQSVPISSDGILKESITTVKSISIPSRSNVITIDFALLDYSNSISNKYKYKLEGFDKVWNEMGNKNSATYTNLPSGEYLFRVKASNNNSIENEKEADLQIIIVPEFYQTLWFKFSFGFCVIFLAAFTIQVRMKRIKTQNKLLENRVNERTKDLDGTVKELSQEIIERKKAEEKVSASLKEKEILLSEKVNLLSEKEVLLKEIHHRVKNNLQVISSLLYLNSKKVKDIEALDMFKDSQNRVKSIALVHERLYQSKDLGKIDFKEYVLKLTNDLFRSYGVDQSLIKIKIDIDNIFINIDVAVPCGLIINEIISNSLKYAFPKIEEEEKNGLISIIFKKHDNQYELVVSDNGIGMPHSLDERKKESLGLQLVDTLVAQLDGSLNIISESGTAFKIKFKL